MIVVRENVNFVNIDSSSTYVNQIIMNIFLDYERKTKSGLFKLIKFNNLLNLSV